MRKSIALAGPALAALCLTIGPSAATAPYISGKVEILDKGDVKRKAVQDVIVYVQGVRAEMPDSVDVRSREIASHDKAFVPHVEAVPMGSAIRFPNLDDIMHNVFSVSRGNRFDLGLYKSGASKVHRFETPGLVRIYCNIHPEMSAFVLVLENPYYCWARPDGSFRIENVPPGTYTVKAWHEQAETESQVTVGEAGVDDVQFVLDARQFKSKPHLNKFGKPYDKRGKYD